MPESVPAAAAARPSTAAQHARFERILDAAASVVTAGGESALQMADLPELAEVSLATLYRYFPSKHHLLFAVAEGHLEAVLERTRRRGRQQDPVRERAAQHLLRLYRVDQRVPHRGALIRRLSALADPAFRAERERLNRLQMDIFIRAVGPVSDRERQILPLVAMAANVAIRSGLAGHLAPEEVRFHILLATRLLEVPAGQIGQDRETARASEDGAAG